MAAVDHIGGRHGSEYCLHTLELGVEANPDACLTAAAAAVVANNHTSFAAAAAAAVALLAAVVELSPLMLPHGKQKRD